MDAQEQTYERLLLLEDVWTGQGRAEYPTIATFHYREALTMRAIPGQPRLFVLQRTQKKTDAGEWVESHWESGFLRALPDGAVEWLDAQNGGRVEVLRGTLQETDDGLVLDFKSALVANDARMEETARQFILRDQILSYTMQMSMTHTPALTLHLAADLTRVVDKPELLKRMETGRAQVLELIARVPAPQLDAPNTIGNWSVKDLLVHFIAQEQRAFEELKGAARGERPTIPSLSDDEFNAQAIQTRRNCSFAQVRAEWDASFAAIRAAVQALDEGDFEPFSPVCVLLEDTIDGALANNTYEHYQEHRPALEAWLQAQHL